jgi:hypothetical protein
MLAPKAADELFRMSPTSSTTAGITDLMQLVSSAATPALSSLLSSAKL